jgi:sugar/nucleoside kinase (ribokinase family)
VKNNKNGKNSKLSKNGILVTGTLAFDSIQTPAGKADHVLGGSANYFSVAASFFAPIKIIGIVGEDFPKEHLKWLAKRKIDISEVEVAPGKSFHWVGSYDTNLNEAQTLSTALNVFEKYNPQVSQVDRNAPYLFLGNIDPALQFQILNQIEDTNLIVCDSMNFWITGKPDDLKKVLKKIDILSINEGEAKLLSGESQLIHAARKIQSMGPPVVVIKRGEYGSTLFTNNSIFMAPAYPVERVVDPTGAGDSFAGAFVGYLAEAKAHRSLRKSNPKKWETLLRRAVLAGCTMASFTVEDFSLHRLMKLKAPELVKRQNELMKMVML